MLICLLFSTLVYSVLGDDCVRYTFEENFQLFSNDLDVCRSHQSYLQWTRESYTNISVLPPNTKTDWFIAPSTSLSCISSFPFSMEAGGVVEVNVYLDPTEREDNLAVMVHQIVDTGGHPVVGMGHVSGHTTPGWSVTKIYLTGGVNKFNGYITFLGVAYPGSILIVDSFRYVGPSLDPFETCILYDDDVTITTNIPVKPTATPSVAETTTQATELSTAPTNLPSIIETTIPTTTTEELTLSDDCVKYTFEKQFELFSNDLDGCGSHQGPLSQWNRQPYANYTNILPPNKKSNWFMTPSTPLSCISSFPFTMKASGVIEVQVYLGSIEKQDHIAVMVHQIVDTGSHPVVGMDLLYGDAELGWFVSRIDLVNFGVTPFYGYVTFLGTASLDSLLIVDSFRYVGPSLNPDETCILYEDDNAFTTIPITTSTIVPSTTPTTTSIIETTTELTTIPTTTPSLNEITSTFEPTNTPLISETATFTTGPTTMPTTTPSINEITSTFEPTSTPLISETTTFTREPTTIPSTTPSLNEITSTFEPTSTPLITETTVPQTTETINQNTGCIKYDFEKDFEELFVDNLPGCTNHQEPRASWSLQAYSNATIEPPNVRSKWFISPSVAFSCTSSFNFPMMTGALLEVLTYWDATPGNSLEISVHAFTIGASQALARVQVFTPGWQVVTIPLNVTGTFAMYLTFTGSRSSNSNVIVDSFRYVAPSLDPKECVPYPDDDFDTTTTTDIPISTTTDTTTLDNECVKYTFEEDFDKLLNNNTPCVNLFGIQTLWFRHEYNNSGIISPNEQSKWFISPSSSYSCISTFNFTMISDGLIEIHAYIDAYSHDDHLQIWVNRIVDSNYHTLIGQGFLHAVDHGWHIMRIYLSADTATPFEGYIIFTGLANPNSTVIVDSFRYIPPSSNPEECILYPDSSSTTTIIPSETIAPTTTDAMILTTTGRPTMTTTETTDIEPDNPLEKIIIIKKTKTFRTESTFIKKVFKL